VKRYFPLLSRLRNLFRNNRGKMLLNSIGPPFLQQLPSILSCRLRGLYTLDINLRGPSSLERFPYQRRQ
jgi:hypothetical protein